MRLEGVGPEGPAVHLFVGAQFLDPYKRVHRRALRLEPAPDGPRSVSDRAWSRE
eukprot:NODE_7547_length_561_cov_4.195312_g6523_i0.p4 GENE.NODE_7547_length_561_cov_4.195312_g6523_i0~~NODE_7547_length_561_cov_4.195312_g6523_i0.p4  ORF type:complete len:54 (-),score=1.90 NODE_7547_length_561_cov_4.195312_g6523_i0:21-182(-)